MSWPSTACPLTPGHVAELETTLNRGQATIDTLREELAALPADPDQTADLLQLLPDLADKLPELPQRALRRLYDALNLKISYRPQGRTADVEITLTDTIGDIYTSAPPGHRVGPSSQFCVVLPAGSAPHENTAKLAAGWRSSW